MREKEEIVGGIICNINLVWKVFVLNEGLKFEDDNVLRY